MSSTETLEAIAVETRLHQQRGRLRRLHHQLHAATVATPTFSPAGGTYTTAQTVTITDTTSGATIYYTTNGTTPTTSSTSYSGPITVSSTETLEAIAVKTRLHQQRGRSAAYTISQLPLPRRRSLRAAGTYTTAQTVTITDATAGATIYYTTNGTTPTTSSTQYTGPITVSATETLEAIAVETGYTNSAVATAAYTINARRRRLNADLLARRRDLYHRADGNHHRYHRRRDHLLHHQRNYADDLLDPVRRPHHGQCVGDPGSHCSGDRRHQQRGRFGRLHHKLRAAYDLNADLLTRRGAYTSAQTVTITDATSGATIYYTTNGTTPTTSSTHLLRSDYGQRDGDPRSHCSEHRRHQQRGRLRCLHHKLCAATDGLNADFTPPAGPIPPRRR